MNPRFKKALRKLAVPAVVLFLLYGAFWFVKWKIFAVPTVQSIAFSPDGRILAGAGGWRVPHEGTSIKGAVWLWDASSGSTKYRFIGDEMFQVVAFSEDGTSVAGWQEDGKQFTWDVVTGRLLKAGNSWSLAQTTDGCCEDRIVNERLTEEPDRSLPFVPSVSGCRIANSKNLSPFISRMVTAKHILKKASNAVTEETFLALSGDGNLLAAYKWAEKNKAATSCCGKFQQGS